MPLQAFAPMVQRVMARPRRSIYLREDQLRTEDQSPTQGRPRANEPLEA
jgi:hypothetical protein